MGILIVDNDLKSLHALIKWIKCCKPESEITALSDPVLAMEFIKENRVEIMFTEVLMESKVTGFALTRVLKAQLPNAYVVFVTESDEYAMRAWETHVNGYLQKPLALDKIKTELEYAVH